MDMVVQPICPFIEIKLFLGNKIMSQVTEDGKHWLSSQLNRSAYTPGVLVTLLNSFEAGNPVPVTRPYLVS
jgi:hypothetical protein